MYIAVKLNLNSFGLWYGMKSALCIDGQRPQTESLIFKICGTSKASDDRDYSDFFQVATIQSCTNNYITSVNTASANKKNRNSICFFITLFKICSKEKSDEQQAKIQ